MRSTSKQLKTMYMFIKHRKHDHQRNLVNLVFKIYMYLSIII
jgi:hypothetical protein